MTAKPASVAHDIVVQGDIFGVRPYCRTCATTLGGSGLFSTTLTALGELVAAHEADARADEDRS